MGEGNLREASAFQPQRHKAPGGPCGSGTVSRLGLIHLPAGSGKHGCAQAPKGALDRPRQLASWTPQVFTHPGAGAHGTEPAVLSPGRG